MRGEHLSRASRVSKNSGSSPHARGAHSSVGVWRHNRRIIPACAGSTGGGGGGAPACWDHPRMRGEHENRYDRTNRKRGSSPHARGALYDDGKNLFFTRIIPACAGSTPHQAFTNHLSWDHPRMRGEHISAQSVTVPFEGSSPHARGAQMREYIGEYWLRDHPRMRGEHRRTPRPASTSCGSSPHARGAPSHRRHLLGKRRIIPACAGSTGWTEANPSRTRDHPRMRGEHHIEQRRQFPNPGSSPHARGALYANTMVSPRPRIIPACAGSTGRRKRERRSPADHPRMRGEHTASFVSNWTLYGSSPHARGAQLRNQRTPPSRRIIPACAGSTNGRYPQELETGDHPRMRGEHHSSHADEKIACGSSPHARGALVSLLIHRPDRRIIPACAGSTVSAGLSAT